MRIVAEKINGTRRRVAEAIRDRDVDRIQRLARAQTLAGADWLDVNAGTHPDREPDDLVWLVDTVQAASELPLCLDSANPRALEAALGHVARTPMINSISAAPEHLQDILPIAAAHDCPVVALSMAGKRMPATVEERMQAVQTILSATRSHGIPDDRLYIDPLAMTIATDTAAAGVTFETLRAIRELAPSAHRILGLSNISYGLPARSHVNRAFLTLALQAGLDTAILDPLDRHLRRSWLAAELLLGRDRHCLQYLRAARAGTFDDQPQPDPREGR